MLGPRGQASPFVLEKESLGPPHCGFLVMRLEMYLLLVISQGSLLLVASLRLQDGIRQDGRRFWMLVDLPCPLPGSARLVGLGSIPPSGEPLL